MPHIEIIKCVKDPYWEITYRVNFEVDHRHICSHGVDGTIISAACDGRTGGPALDDIHDYLTKFYEKT